MVLSPKIRHSREDAIGSCFIKDRFTVPRSIVAASDKSPNRHAGRLPRLDAANTVLDHKGSMWIHLHPFRRVEEEIGAGLPRATICEV